MPLSAGTRLGPYEILSPMGAGGMGEVYRAKDPRLGREVAVKVLPEALAQDRDRLSRFEQEARAASALNHPNIVTIHEIGREGDVAFIAMELVEGTTLRELTASGPMPVRRVLNVAAQVAEGLSKAHSAGIVHRDLKPENVMVSKDGFVKILDFGLAKLVEPESGGVSAMPTLAHAGDASRDGDGDGRLHVAGAGLGGASGFSVGPVFAGLDRLRDGDGQEGVPEEDGARRRCRRSSARNRSRWRRLRPDLPLPVRWILERCLSKDREDRYASTKDLARDLASLRDRLAEVSSGAEALLPAPGKASPARAAARCSPSACSWRGSRSAGESLTVCAEGDRSRSIVQAFDLSPASDRNRALRSRRPDDRLQFRRTAST